MTSQPDPEAVVSEPTPVDTTPLCDGRFVPFRRLGSGSQGETFEAVDRATGRAVALKRFDIHGASSWKDVELAEREARVLRTLSHPALPAYVLHFEHNGALYLAMEKIDGRSLAQALADGQRFSFGDLLSLLEALGNVFLYLHGQSPAIVHRDIKPSNILKRENGEFVVIDFGSVRDGFRNQEGSTVVGTFGYMAPEQFQGRALPASDLYGTGATLLTLLTGKSPDRLPHRGLEIDVRAAVPPNTPEPWIALLEQLTSADPDKRNVDLRILLPALRQPSRATEGSAQSRSGGATSSPKVASHLDEPVPDWLASTSLTLPFPLIVILQILRVILYVGLQIALPLVLTLLSVIFGRGLRHAAKEVSESGTTAVAQLTHLIERSSPASREERKRARQARRQNARRRWQGGEWYQPHDTTVDDSHKRRIRVGDYDVEMPKDSSQDATLGVERARKK